MHLKITHRTEYRYDEPLHYALQRLRLVPLSGTTQTVVSWALAIDGAREEVRFADQFGNDTRLISCEGDPRVISIEASGEVVTQNTAGVTGPHRSFAPLWLFSHETNLTKPGEGVRAVAASVKGGGEIDRLHSLSELIRRRVDYRTDTTDSGTSAEEAVSTGSGVCQDHAHIFCAAARLLGFPARYVSGYLLMNGQTEQVAMHAWAEAHIATLGWVAFDVSNGISPDERYARIAVGRDYRDAMPASGIRFGRSEERLVVEIRVEQ